jgi:GST-like protein
MITIYGLKGWGSAIIEGVCALTSHPYALEEVDPTKPGPASDRLRAINPLVQVPTVVLEDGTVMTESVAIVLLLLERHPEANLCPLVGDARRPTFLRWLAFFVASIYPMFTVGDFPARWVDDPEAQKQLKARSVDRTLACWRILEEGLAPTQYMLGDSLTAIDVYASIMTRWRPGRDRIRAVAPRVVAAAERAEAHPLLAPVFARNFPDQR